MALHLLPLHSQDGVAIKSGWDCFGLDVARPTQNVLLRNLTIRSPNAAGICIGRHAACMHVHCLHTVCVRIAHGLPACTLRAHYECCRVIPMRLHAPAMHRRSEMSGGV